MKFRALFGSSALALVLLTSGAHAQDVQVSDSARQHFKTGVAYLKDPDGARYEEAYREFKAAYGDSPSWKILGNLGITAMKLERDGEAIEAFEKYLSQGGQQIDAGERTQMESDLLTTKAGVVTVSITVNPAGATITDERQPLTGRPVTNRYDVAPDGVLHVGIRRGRHKITATLDGHVDQTWELDAEPGPEQTHQFALQPTPVATPNVGQPGGGGTTPAQPEMTRPISVPVIIAASVTGAFLIGAGVTGGLALSKGSEYKDKNDGRHVSEAQNLHDSTNTMNIVADSLLIGAVAGGVVTTILFLNRPYVAANGGDAGATARRFEVVPAIGAGVGGVVMSGRF